jgi:hypothetical protein
MFWAASGCQDNGGLNGMGVNYVFAEGDRVYSCRHGKAGEVNVVVPGDGTGTGWYEFVAEDGTVTELVQADDLKRL